MANPVSGTKNRYTILALIILLGLALRLYGIGSQSFWYDEVATMKTIQKPFINLMAYCFINGHSPLYFLLLRFWTFLFGFTETAARLPSVLFGISSIYLLFLLTRLLFNIRSALFSAFFMAISVVHILYSQEARLYSMLVFISVLATFLLVKALGLRSRSMWLGYSASILMTLLLSSVGVLVLLFHVIFMLLCRKFYRNSFPLFVSSVFAAIIAALPLFVIIIKSRFAPLLSWIPPISLIGIEKTFANFMFFRWPSLVDAKLAVGYHLVAFFFASICILALWRLFKEGLTANGILLLSWFAVPHFTIFVISLFISPMLVTRYLLFASCPLYILLATYVSGLKNRVWRAAVLSAILILSIASLVQYYEFEARPKWKDAASFISANIDPEEEISVCPGFEAMAFSYYYKDGNKVIPLSSSIIAQTDLESKGGWLVVRVGINDFIDGKPFARYIEDRFGSNPSVTIKKYYGELKVYRLPGR